ncbi:MAG: hypothetical protein Q7U99_20550 [Rubrivivax sp.]|nr:hypothetical protein [Rubrivivax sp.]
MARDAPRRPVLVPRAVQRWCHGASRCAVALGVAAAAGECLAVDDEFATLRITEVTGALTFKQLSDRTETRSGTAGASWAQSDRSNTLVASVAAQGFIYHPNLVSLEGGFGLIGQRSRFNSDAVSVFGDTRASERLYDLSARVTVLRDKPYTGSVYYEHLNPSVSVGPALVIIQETKRQGVQLALLEPFTPVPMTFDAERLDSSGRGSGRVVDEHAERYSLTANRAIGRLGSTRLRVDNSRLDSQSGSVGLPISRTASNTLTAGLDTRLQFGSVTSYALTNLITYNTLGYSLGAEPPANRRDLRGYLDLRARHSPQLQSFATVDVLNASQGARRSHSRAGFGGATWTPVVDLVSTFELRAESLDATDYATSSRSTLASTSYQRNWAGGRAQAAYAVRHDARSQQSSSPSTPVIGEVHVLAGTAAVALDRNRVLSGSLQVWNAARTQLFVEGRDYRLTLLGEQTRLERIVSGDIVDGQTVLADYAVETGGSFDSTQVDQTLSLFWSWANRFSLSARWFDSAPRVSAGVPLLTLNTVRSRILRAQADLPVAGLWSAGGSLEHESRHETILPFQRTAAEAYVQWEEALFGQGGIRVGVHRQRVAYDDALQDVDLVGYDLRYRVFTLDGIDIQADWTLETDTGRAVTRRREFASLRARWRVRQLLMTLSLTRAHESQDNLQTTRTVGQWLLQRDF